MNYSYSFTRYLAAKKSVDDRALNHHVWDALAGALPPCTADAPLQVLEIGAGIGTMVERMLERGLLTHANYTMLDSQPENLAHAMQRLPDWASQRGCQVEKGPGGMLNISGAGINLRLDSVIGDLFDFIPQARKRARWSLLIAHAFLDLVDIPATLPLLFELCQPDGLFYFSVNFDGLTSLEPVIDAGLDRQILRLYHHSMDERRIAGRPSGDSRSGRRLFAHLQASGGQILAAGASDWVVYPGVDGYPQDEAYFLHYIVETIYQALSGHAELDQEIFERWIARRHAQIEDRQLVYIAHQLDFAGRVA